MSDATDRHAAPAPTGPDPAFDAAPEAARAAVFGCAGPDLSSDERAFFRDAAPLGFILFARNVDTPDRLRRLTDALRDAVGWHAPVLIDQEGGRVARLGAPHWRVWPAVGALVDPVDLRAGGGSNPAGGDRGRADRGDAEQARSLQARIEAAGVEKARIEEARIEEALRLRYRLIADELRAVGVDVNCAPLLDVRRTEAHEIIGDRALGRAPERVAARGAAVIAGLLAGGVAPVIKHLPGHGRAGVDSHETLPRVDADRAALETVDLAPFRAHAGAAFGMTAHVVYSAFDPDDCATLSKPVIDGVVRGSGASGIGFEGALMTDDLSMKALEGPFRARAERSLAAGCDLVLHCNGDPAEMRAVAEAGPRLSGAARARVDRALGVRRAPEPLDPRDALARLAALGPGAAPVFDPLATKTG